MELVELQATRREAFRIRRLAGAAESAGGAKPNVVNQDDQDVWRALGRASCSMGGFLVSGSLASYVIGPVRSALGIGRWERSFLSSLLIARKLSGTYQFVLNFREAAFPVQSVGCPRGNGNRPVFQFVVAENLGPRLQAASMRSSAASFFRLDVRSPSTPCENSISWRAMRERPGSAIDAGGLGFVH